MAVLILAVIIIGIGGVWLLIQQGNTDTAPAVTEAKTIVSAGDVPRITPRELKAKLDAGQAVLFDARPQTSYDRQHITGALSLPEGEVAARLAELPTDKLAVFYCT